MGFNEKENSLEYWDNIHSKYERNEIKLDDWLDKFETIIDSCSTPILDLGCGSGNDTLYLINKNKQVISCDQSSNAINNIKKNFPEVYDTKCFNMLDGMPFDNNSFDHQIKLKLPIFLPAERSDQVFEFRIDPELSKSFLCHAASCVPAVLQF